MLVFVFVCVPFVALGVKHRHAKQALASCSPKLNFGHWTSQSSRTELSRPQQQTQRFPIMAGPTRMSIKLRVIS